MKILVGADQGSYVFAPGVAGTGTVTLAGLPALQLSQILLIVNTASGTILYNALDPTSLGTLTGSVLTLQRDSSLMHSVDPLQIWVSIPSSQHVTVDNPTTAVSVSNLPATQPVSAAALPLPAGAAQDATLTGGSMVTKLADAAGVNKATVSAAGALKVDGSGVTQPVSGTVTISGTPAVSVSNLPATQTVSGTVSIGNFPATQPVSGAVTVSNLPATQPVSGTVAVSTVDNTQLDTQQETQIGTGNTYGTTGYQTISFQFAGMWEGSAQILGSNDNVNWVPLWAQNSTDGSNTDLITGNGIFTAAASTKYIQYTFLTLTGTAAITVIGKISVQDDTALLAQSFDSTTGVQINTNIAGGVAKDPNNALVLSDALPIQVMGIVNAPIIIDTKGYQTLQITTQALVASSVLTSNDGINWSTLYGLNAASSTTIVTALVASSSYSFPCTSRYVKIVPTTAGTATVFLRNQPWTGSYTTTNITQIANNSVVTAGVNGTVAVGGSTAVGATPTLYPLVVGGVDSGSLARRLLTDTTGRPVISAVDQTATNRSLGLVSPASAIQNIAVLAVQDLAQFEGQSITELLAQILVELKINNYYLFNLPAILSSGTVNPPSDEPALIRNEPSVLQ